MSLGKGAYPVTAALASSNSAPTPSREPHRHRATACQALRRPACNRHPSNRETLMTAVALALHIFGAVVWVGGMFAIYVCLRPALGTLEPPQRLQQIRVTFQKFFPWV